MAAFFKRNRYSLRVAAVCTLLLFPFDAHAEEHFSVGGKITRYRTDKPIYLALYESAEAMKQRQYTQCLRFQAGSFSKDSILYEFKNVPAGEYVVAVFQDYNGDRKLNFGPLGPTEPYRVYRPHYGVFGPDFSNCKFTVNRDFRGADLVLGAREIVESKRDAVSGK